MNSTSSCECQHTIWTLGYRCYSQQCIANFVYLQRDGVKQLLDNTFAIILYDSVENNSLLISPCAKLQTLQCRGFFITNRVLLALTNSSVFKNNNYCQFPLSMKRIHCQYSVPVVSVQKMGSKHKNQSQYAEVSLILWPCVHVVLRPSIPIVPCIYGILPRLQTVVVLLCSEGSLWAAVSMSIRRKVGRRG